MAGTAAGRSWTIRVESLPSHRGQIAQRVPIKVKSMEDLSHRCPAYAARSSLTVQSLSTGIRAIRKNPSLRFPQERIRGRAKGNDRIRGLARIGGRDDFVPDLDRSAGQVPVSREDLVRVDSFIALPSRNSGTAIREQLDVLGNQALRTV